MDNTRNENNNNNNENNIIINDGIIDWKNEDIMYLIYKYLTPKETGLSMNVCHIWYSTGKCNSIWEIHLKSAFNKDFTKYPLNKKYDNSYYKYFILHPKLRYDGIYILKVAYFVAAEQSIHIDKRTVPYTKIKYFRYIRFLKNKQAIYSLSKKSPSKYPLFKEFNINTINNKMKHYYSNNNYRSKHENINENVYAFIIEKNNGIMDEEKIFKSKYKNKKKYVELSIYTDYGTLIEMDCKYLETDVGRSDRLKIIRFDGYSLNNNNKKYGNPIHYPIRDECFCFIPDTQFNDAYLMYE